ncbi:MAG TPA: hypothetical protein VF962_02695 [Gemmatimonadaceae bacterium]
MIRRVVLLLCAAALTRVVLADTPCKPTTPKGSQSRTKLKHRVAAPTTATATTVGDIVAWPVPDLADPKVRRSNSPIDPREQRAFTLRGDLWRVKQEANDCDYHLEIVAPGGSDTDRRVIVELPREEDALQKQLVKAVTEAGQQASGKDFSTALPITVTGYAFIDGAHWSKKNPKKGNKHGSKYVETLWELHPVLKLTTKKQ